MRFCVYALLAFAGLDLSYLLALAFVYGFHLAHLYFWPLLSLGCTALACLIALFPPMIWLAAALALIGAFGLMRVLAPVPRASCPAQQLLVLGVERHFRLLSSRATCAAQLLAAQPAATALLSGGNGEAEALRAIICAAHIAPERLICESASLSTQENMQNCAQLTDPTRLTIIVTNRFHGRRALHLAKSAGFNCIGCTLAPTPVLLAPHAYLRELAILFNETLHGKFDLWRKP